MVEVETTPHGAALEALAKLLHESGREAVEQGMVFMKGPDITPRPFAEWADLPAAARVGRFLMAKYVIEHAAELLAIIQSTLPASDLEAASTVKRLSAWFGWSELSPVRQGAGIPGIDAIDAIAGVEIDQIRGLGSDAPTPPDRPFRPL